MSTSNYKKEKILRSKIRLDSPGIKDFYFPFEKEGEENEVLIVVDGSRKGDYVIKVLVEHLVGNNSGKVRIRGIAKNGANLKIEGMIKINKGSNKVDDFLDIRILLLDDKSAADAQPKLEIEANDVKASHAATVSKIDGEQIFYLTSKGMSRLDAEELIVKGFLSLE